MKAIVAQAGKGFSAKTKPTKKRAKKVVGTKLQTPTHTVQTVAPDAIAKLAPKLVGAHHQALQTAQGWQTVDKGAASGLLDHSLHSIWPPAITSSPDNGVNGTHAHVAGLSALHSSNDAITPARAGSSGAPASLSAEDQAALGELADLMQQWEMLDGEVGAGRSAVSAQEAAAEAASEAAAALASQRWQASEAPKDFKTAASQLLGLAAVLPAGASAAAAPPAAAAAGAELQHVQAEEAMVQAVAGVAAAPPAELETAEPLQAVEAVAVAPPVQEAAAVEAVAVEAVPAAASAAAGSAAAAAPAAAAPELLHSNAESSNVAAIAAAAPEASIKSAPAAKAPAVKKATRVSAKAKTAAAAAAAAGMRAAAPQGPVCSEAISEARHELAGVEQQMGRLAELLAEAHSTLHMVQQDMAVQHVMVTSSGSGGQVGGAVLPGSGAHAQAMTAAAEGAVAKVEVAAWGELVMLMADVMLDVQGELGALQQVVQENNIRLEVAAGVAREHEAAAAAPAERDAALSLAVVGVQACLERLQELRRV